MITFLLVVLVLEFGNLDLVSRSKVPSTPLRKTILCGAYLFGAFATLLALSTSSDPQALLLSFPPGSGSSCHGLECHFALIPFYFYGWYQLLVSHWKLGAAEPISLRAANIFGGLLLLILSVGSMYHIGNEAAKKTPMIVRMITNLG